MEYFDRNGEIEVTGVGDFDLVRIFECGQCFRWEADANGVYTGVAFGCVVRLRREGESVFISGGPEDFEKIWRGYFDLDRDYAEIRRRLCVDEFMCRAAGYGSGIRILRQDRWEALCSFIISQCNNIPRIKKIIAALCHQFGDRLEFGGEEYYAFPSAERLAALGEADLAPLRCGYRAPYILGAAEAVVCGKLDLDSLSKKTPEEARKALKKLRGVGDKVADCVMLFGLNMLDAFPRDIWMRRALAEHYGPGFDAGIFTPYAGVAQQYIFYYARSLGQK